MPASPFRPNPQGSIHKNQKMDKKIPKKLQKRPQNALNIIFNHFWTPNFSNKKIENFRFFASKSRLNSVSRPASPLRPNPQGKIHKYQKINKKYQNNFKNVLKIILNHF